MLDLVVTGATVQPGDGPAVVTDIGLSDGRIASIGDATSWEAAERIDGRGRLLCPGFIDLHAHSGLRVFEEPVLGAKIGQGFTTELINPDGLSPAPVSAAAWAEREAYLRPIEGPGPPAPSWGSVDAYLGALEMARPATNLVACVAHNAVREHVMGTDDRPPTREELAMIRSEVRAALEAGARAVSFGLIYVPGVFARSDELVAIAEEAVAFGAPLVPHVRNEGADVLPAVSEMIEVARRSGARLNLSHLKVIGNEHLVDPLLDLIDEAAADIEISYDHYPYGAGSTTLAAILPPWSLAGGRAATLARLADRDVRARILDDVRVGLAGWENIYHSCGPDDVVVVAVPASMGGLVGRTLTAIGEARGMDPLEAALDLLAEARLEVTMIDHYATETVVRRIFRHPRALVGSDGIFGSHPHPRLHATAARVLGRYAIREALIPVEEAVARLTSRPADLLGLSDRGRIREGLRADLVLLDPGAYVDTATFDEPSQSPPGVTAVLVGGQLVVRDGVPTGARPGQVVRRPRGGR